MIIPMLVVGAAPHFYGVTICLVLIHLERKPFAPLVIIKTALRNIAIERKLSRFGIELFQ